MKWVNKVRDAFRRKDGRVDYLAVVFVIAVMFFIGWRLYVYDKASSGLDLSATTSTNETFYDDILNYTIKFPKGWEFDVAEQEIIQEAATQASNGLPFSLMEHQLKTEVVPLVMLGQKGTEGYKIFTSLALRGTDKKATNLEDLLKPQTDDFVELLESMGHTDIKVVASDVIKAGNYIALRIKVEALSSGTNVYYTETVQVIGKNLALVTFGSLVDDAEAQNICLDILNSIKVVDNL